MGKVLEGPGMALLKKWGIETPNYVVVTAPDQLGHLAQVNTWLRERRLVVKAHEAIGGRFKLGLVKVDRDLAAAIREVEEMFGREVGGVPISQVIISEMVPHDREFYLAVKSTRAGAEILLASVGGIEIEGQWDRVRRLEVEVGDRPEPNALLRLAEQAGFSPGLTSKVAEAAGKLYDCFDHEDGQYLEINPLVSCVEPKASNTVEPKASNKKGDGDLVALDAVVLVDGDARFRHPDWNFTFASGFGRPYTDDERQIMEIDARVKGSVKFVQIPGGDTALLPAGGGASVYYTDAVVALGGKPANYAEYSGDPPDWAVEALTDKVCSLPGIKRIIVGGAIANFTNVKKTFSGIVAGFRRAKSEGKLDGVEIWVRRGGPYEKEGLAAMAALKEEGFHIHVYDRYTPMTDIVDMALGKAPVPAEAKL